MSCAIRPPLSVPMPPLVLVPPRERLAMERAFLEDSVAASLSGDPASFDSRLSAPAACARVARTRDPLATAEALALALADPLIAAERGTFDGSVVAMWAVQSSAHGVDERRGWRWRACGAGLRRRDATGGRAWAGSAGAVPAADAGPPAAPAAPSPATPSRTT